MSTRPRAVFFILSSERVRRHAAPGGRRMHACERMRTCHMRAQHGFSFSCLCMLCQFHASWHALALSASFFENRRFRRFSEATYETASSRHDACAHHFSCHERCSCCMPAACHAVYARRAHVRPGSVLSSAVHRPARQHRCVRERVCACVHMHMRTCVCVPVCMRARGHTCAPNTHNIQVQYAMSTRLRTYS